ncbi:MAG: DUF1684 domain-containing protein [Spirosomaceae bacterium]|nr:DUF1684 domain-containing protein [Spirosomataceae bacterium]
MHKLLALLSLFTFGIANAQSYADSLQKHRENYVHELIKDGPLDAADSAMVDFYAANESFKVKCKFVATKSSEPFEIPTSAGTTKTYTKFGEFRFKLNGKKQKLAVYRSSALLNHPLYKNYLFIPFKDKTNGAETYGGGRYLDLYMKDVSGSEIVLDFNKAYNPYCAFSEGYSCPIPPQENHLKISVEAGEKNFRGGH